MRYGSSALGVVFLVAPPVLAADPSAASPPPKPPAPAVSVSAAPKPAAPPPASAAPSAPAAPKPAVAPAAPPQPAVPPKPTAPPASGAAATGSAATSGPKPGDTPPAEYYVEPGFAAPAADTQEPPAHAAPGAPPPAPGGPLAPPGPPPPPLSDTEIYEPPPPGFYPGEGVFEPPPPPEPHHISARSAFWLGVRVGWFIPFGNAWSRGTSDSVGNLNLKGVPLRDYLSSGPMFELDVGARLARNYQLFALWERAELGAGRGDLGSATPGRSSGGDTDFWAVGVRATSDADRVGFVTELAVGYRRARAQYDDGSEVQFTDSPFEARLGVGADIRVNPIVTLSPMLTVGVGSFGKIDRVVDRTVADHTGPDDRSDGHAWTTLTLGGHFDLFGSRK